jgi:hypothetical protein
MTLRCLNDLVSNPPFRRDVGIGGGNHSQHFVQHYPPERVHGCVTNLVSYLGTRDGGNRSSRAAVHPSSQITISDSAAALRLVGWF